MKWQTVARCIIDRLSQANNFSPSERDYAQELWLCNDAERLFSWLRGKAIENENIFGWNKIWSGGNLYSWWGRVVTIEPLRLVALELSAGDDDLIRNILQSVYNGQAIGFYEQVRELAEFSVELTAPLSAEGLSLLQRLNLDCRERPFIERWHWAGDNGMAYLSDGGRLQITQTLAWTRALETIIDEKGFIDEDIIQTIIMHQNNSLDIIVPSTQVYLVEKLGEKLSFFGIGRAFIDGLRLAVPLNDSVRRVVKLLKFNIL